MKYIAQMLLFAYAVLFAIGVTFLLCCNYHIQAMPPNNFFDALENACNKAADLLGLIVIVIIPFGIYLLFIQESKSNP